MAVLEIERGQTTHRSPKGDAVLQCPNCSLPLDVSHDDLAAHWPVHCGASMRVLYNG